MNDPHRNGGAAAFADRRDSACDDGELLRMISKGDEGAMAAFYREHGKVVLAQVLLVTGERALAEEIVQDTMLAVWRGAASFRGESSVRSWVLAIARRQTRDRLRGRRLRLVDDAFLAASGALLGEITDGAAVTVAGTSSDGTLAADLVIVSANPPSLAVPGTVTVRGTVADAGTAGFTVVTSANTRVPVTTSGATAVTVSHASLSQ